MNNFINIEQLLIRALLAETSCNMICKYGYIECGYPECKKNWCNNYENFELDIDKLKKEYKLK